MSQEILDLIKDNVMNIITNNDSVPNEKKGQAIEATSQALFEGFKNNISLDNLSSLANLFSGEKNNLASNQFVNGVQNDVVSSLIQKVGLSKAVADTIAVAVVPMVIKAFSSKINDSSSFNLNSLIDLFSKGDNNSGGILGTLGKLFS